jgi:hypothetical protein
LPQVVSGGGPVLASPRLVPITFAADPAAADVWRFLEQLAGSGYWAEVTSEYGVGPLTVETPVSLAEPPPNLTSMSDAEGWLKSKLGSPSSLPAPTNGTVYALFLPAPALGYSGLHADLALASGTLVPYVVVSTALGTDDMTSTASHELAEAATDPHPLHNPAFYDLDADHLAWDLLDPTSGPSGPSASWGEIGDVCEALIQPLSVPPGVLPPPPPPSWSMVSVTVPQIDHAVQRLWSNRAATLHHDPCQPYGMSPYFNSAPVLGDAIVALSSVGQSITTRGLHLPVGQTRTIEVDLFSDEPTGPWTVDVVDRTPYVAQTCPTFDLGSPPAPDSGAPVLPPPVDPTLCQPSDPRIQASFDTNQGQDGDRIHLTLTQRSSAPGGQHLLILTSTLGLAQTIWPMIVSE